MSPGFGIYVHWPFCTSKCPYCDFNSHVAEAVDDRRWRAALLGELGHFASETQGRQVSSVFFGGGTPSLMDPATVAALIQAVDDHWPVAGDVEITLEANPSTAEAGRFRAFRDAGVNRLSLGVQSLDDQALAFLGRTHGAREAMRALAMAADTFRRISFDLIYARPGQTVAAWRAELERAVELAGGHISVYQLTIEAGTAFHKSRIEEASEGTAAALFEATEERLGKAGLAAYEVSNHARPGEACRHNLNCWRGGDYLGVGPGAHGRLSANGRTDAIRQIPRPDRWLSAVETRGHGTANRTALEVHERREELLMTGLRLTEGVRRDTFRRLAGANLDDVLDGARTASLVEGGFLVADQAGLRTTAAGRLRLNAVIAALLAEPPP